MVMRALMVMSGTARAVKEVIGKLIVTEMETLIFQETGGLSLVTIKGAWVALTVGMVSALSLAKPDVPENLSPSPQSCQKIFLSSWQSHHHKEAVHCCRENGQCPLCLYQSHYL